MLSKTLSDLKKRLLHGTVFPHLSANVLPVRNLRNLKAAMGWTEDPLLEGGHLAAFEHIGDLNERRLRDAEALGAACRNGDPRIILEIGTGSGLATALMSRNAPGAVIHTVNIPPDEIGEGGKNVTYAPGIGDIGARYREAGCRNVRQILANTRDWEPDFGPIDVAFIDGCHDADFVYGDTRRILSRCRPGGLLLWHDFSPPLARAFHWIDDVCRGVERLYEEGLIEGPIYHLEDSFVGLHKIRGAADR
jgi:predicted O-methyltransferase YrrM